ncbi:MAG: hypothetical protein ABWW69_01480 [Pyrodictiaceae archaeon]
MKILVSDVWMLIPGLKRKGFIVLEDGEVKAYGDAPPEEYQYAELVIGGDGRVLLAGFTYIGSIEPYPIRHLAVRLDPIEFLYSDIARRLARVDPEKAYYSSLVALYELALSGFTEVVAIDPHPREIAEAMRKIGLHGAVLVPVGCSYQPPGWREALEAITESTGFKGIVRPGVMLCKNVSDMLDSVLSRYEDIIVFIDRNGFLETYWPTPKGFKRLRLSLKLSSRGYDLYGLGVLHYTSPFQALCQLASTIGVEEAYERLTVTPWSLLWGLKIPSSLVVIDIREPPCWVPKTELIDVSLLTTCMPRIETVISKGNVVVDAGMGIEVGAADVEKARPVLEELAEVLGG